MLACKTYRYGFFHLILYRLAEGFEVRWNSDPNFSGYLVMILIFSILKVLSFFPVTGNGIFELCYF